ncbi:BlaI/MecI/CopY family transcriptional regulator [Streptomyces olivaceoviridis]
MSETMATTTTDLVTQYSARLASDLERNAEAQDAVRTELEHLEARLLALRHSHSVLLTMRQALERGVPRTQPSGSDGRGANGRAPGARGAAGRIRHRPTLVSLVRAEVASRSEPCSAGEVTAALREARPGRVIKATVVRTTLEGLVVKGDVRRVKQGRSVRYSAA